jgi:bacteriocin-like protein
MKTTENNNYSFSELNYEELSAINGGSFAYDLGRFLRYMGIYYANGTGIPGTVAANIDFVINMIQNE